MGQSWRNIEAPAAVNYVGLAPSTGKSAAQKYQHEKRRPTEIGRRLVVMASGVRQTAAAVVVADRGYWLVKSGPPRIEAGGAGGGYRQDGIDLDDAETTYPVDAGQG